MTLTGIVQNGVVVLENGRQLPEGTRVVVTIHQPVRAASILGETLLRHAGKAVGLPADLAEQHDHYLHGLTRRGP